MKRLRISNEILNDQNWSKSPNKPLQARNPELPLDIPQLPLYITQLLTQARLGHAFFKTQLSDFDSLALNGTFFSLRICKGYQPGGLIEAEFISRSANGVFLINSATYTEFTVFIRAIAICLKIKHYVSMKNNILLYVLFAVSFNASAQYSETCETASKCAGIAAEEIKKEMSKHSALMDEKLAELRLLQAALQDQSTPASKRETQIAEFKQKTEELHMLYKNVNQWLRSVQEEVFRGVAQHELGHNNGFRSSRLL